MKKKVTLFLLAFAAIQAQAQITLTQASYSAVTARTDSSREVSGTMPTAAANVTADLTGNVYGAGHDYVFTAANAGFANATFGSQFIDGINSSVNNGITWTASMQRAITSAGMMAYGEAISRQAYSIAITTGNTLDSVVMPVQNIVYSTPRTIIKFPATFQSSWTNNYQSTTNINVTATNFGLNATAFSRVTAATDSSVVTGWGKMRVKNMSGTNSGYMDVLAVKTHVHFRDSLMMGAIAAPAPLLAAFGFTQGAMTDLYYISWYRSGEVMPLLRVYYTDNTYSNPEESEVHMNRLAAPTGIGSVAQNAANIGVFPNPAVAGSNLNIELNEGSNGSWTYELISAAGQIMVAAPLPVNGKQGTVALPASTANGMYYLHLLNNGKPAAVKPVSIRN